MAEFYDAVIVGGGPAGSTVATALARLGRRVVLFEREKFPRFHVGESLLPFNLPIFERLGVAEKIAAAGFQKKYGAFFWNEATGGTRPVVFEQGINNRHPAAYHVKRADFDQLLLDHAGESGAEIHDASPVSEVLLENGAAAGVVVQSANGGAARQVRARVVVDASGQDALLSRKLGTLRFDSKLKRAGLFAHYEGVCWPEGHRPGDILLPIDDGVWYWIIPFSDGTSSVGAVFDPTRFRGEGRDLEARFEDLIARSARMRELLAGSRRSSGVFGFSDYSTSSARLAGNGYLLVGDAATFLDPVFSTGVFLAMATGEYAAQAIHHALTRTGRITRADLSAYERKANRLFRRFRRFVYAFYDPVFFEAFCTKSPFDPMRAAVTTTLAGGIEKVPLSARLWTELVFLGVAFDRFLRRLGLGPKRAEEGSVA